MLTEVFVLQNLVARGEISCGMVVSGEYISHLSWNAARQIRSLFSKQLASLTLAGWSGRSGTGTASRGRQPASMRR
jgi:hypothetical protein